MALGLKPTVANSELNALLRATSYTGPATLFVKLHIGDPGAAGTANPAGNTTRQAITFGVASGGVSTNDSAPAWTNVSTTETYTHVSIWDASSAGNFLCSGTLTANQVFVGDNFTVQIGGATVTLNAAA